MKLTYMTFIIQPKTQQLLIPFSATNFDTILCLFAARTAIVEMSSQELSKGASKFWPKFCWKLSRLCRISDELDGGLDWKIFDLTLDSKPITTKL